MPLFETKLNFTQYLMLTLSAFFIPIIAIILYFIADEKSDTSYLFFVITLFIPFGFVYLSYIIKSFHLFNDCLIIRRPLHFWKSETTFQKTEIEKVRFWLSTSRIGAGYYAGIKTKHNESSFMIVNSRKTLLDFITALQAAGIETDVQFEIK
ncbi:MAG: hypothetical protein DI539_09210 [Flavobacterium psychrophilum]|nr:MAG: hypothetical protein DI539_09210 [Flavobacterium psychrophilum]